MTPQPPQPTEDQTEDLLYFARAGETADFVQALSETKAALPGLTDAEILLAARDEHSQNNVLHMTCGNGHLELTKKILSLLLAPVAPDAPPHELLSQKNSAGNTPLHWAALNGHLPVVQTLVMAANADPTITNAAGHDAVFEAEANEKGEVVDWLLGHCEGLEEVIKGSVDGEEEFRVAAGEKLEEGKGKEVEVVDVEMEMGEN